MPRPTALLALAALHLVPSVAAQTPDPALLRAAVAYAAKVAASAQFVSGRSLDSVLAEELAPDRPLEALLRPLLRFDVDRERRTVTCRALTATATAAATGNLGCTLVPPDGTAAALRDRAAPTIAAASRDATRAWPLGDRAEPGLGIDAAAMARAVDAAFAEADDGPPVRTRAVVVVHGGRLVAERYAAGYDAAMPLPGWSMSKTLVNALVGRRVQQGALDLDAPPAVAEWRGADDPRAAIRWPHLLTMTAGLAWNESYDEPASDVLRMLFAAPDHAAVYAESPVAAAPGTEFRYSSGCSNLVCRLLRSTFANDADYWAFPRDALFAPLGMHSAVLETDASGTFVGSSYGFATARDWARFGLFLADDGVAPDGNRLLPQGWLARSTTPAPASRGRFGWHVWLNADPDGDGPAARRWPDLPAELLLLEGHEGQHCVVLPSRRFVLVRLGCTKRGGFDLHGLVRGALAAGRT
ncbi:MAG: serine hydrolase [Planctomycetes bacterium]|nr:serine hydrolase [Planctomycetota bacterium]